MRALVGADTIRPIVIMEIRAEKNFIRFLVTLVAVFVASIFLSATAFAKNNVSSISMDVVIHNNGSATITQQWTGTFDTGTEVYLPIEDNSLIVKNFKVSMNGREFTRTEGWDVNASFQNKSFTCGINRTSKGVELCFGISNYGNNIYVFSYDIDPLVKAYDDADGFNFQFINPGMDIFPTDVAIRIRLDNGQELSTQNARIWGFGYYGETQFVDGGYAVAYTTTPLRSSNYLNVMLKIYKGVLAPNVKGSGTFEDLKNAAFVGSTYEETLRGKRGLSLSDIIFGIIFGIGILGLISAFISKVKRKTALKRFYSYCNYFRDTPNGGDIAVSHTLFKDFDIWKNKESNIIGAIIMKMINEKNLEPVQEKSYGFFGKEKVNTSLRVGAPPTDPLIKELYDLIIVAAGSDGVLQENELKEYAKQNYNELNNYLDKILIEGHNRLNVKNSYVRVNGNRIEDLSNAGKNELEEIYGLRKFLDEFTLISERSVTEGVIWENLIVYATLFGIAKKVLKELKDLYPDRIVEIERYESTYYVSDAYFRTLYWTSLNTRRAIEAARLAKMAADGLGGASSIGGGGGFSGGGSGGGTR